MVARVLASTQLGHALAAIAENTPERAPAHADGMHSERIAGTFSIQGDIVIAMATTSADALSSTPRTAATVALVMSPWRCADVGHAEAHVAQAGGWQRGMHTSAASTTRSRGDGGGRGRSEEAKAAAAEAEVEAERTREGAS
ncbi:hypothetical protein EV121DRAFT_297959 [Schizophyllum commune]